MKKTQKKAARRKSTITVPLKQMAKLSTDLRGVHDAVVNLQAVHEAGVKEREETMQLIREKSGKIEALMFLIEAVDKLSGAEGPGEELATSIVGGFGVIGEVVREEIERMRDYAESLMKPTMGDETIGAIVKFEAGLTHEEALQLAKG